MEAFLELYTFELVILLMIWVLPWKGVALWHAARKSDKVWFVVLLVVNSLAILDILYIFFISKRKSLVEKQPVASK